MAWLMVLGFANSLFGGGVGAMTGRRSGGWHPALAKLSGQAPAWRLRAVKWYAHQAYRNGVSQVLQVSTGQLTLGNFLGSTLDI